jgi:hypothetical protein
MSTLKVIVLGTLIGVVISILTLGLALAGMLLLTGQVAIIESMVFPALINGALLGATGVTLSYLTSGRERYVLVLLIGLVIAALAVMVGRYGNGSLIPVGIYVLAMVNGLLTSRATAALDLRSNTSAGPYLRG